MPVIGTPITTTPLTQGTGNAQRTYAPVVTRVEGAPVFAKPQAVQIVQGQAQTIQWTLRDQIGNPVDIDDVLMASATIQVQLREALSFSGNTPPTIVTGSVVDPGNGLVQATLPVAVTAAPGISVMEWGVLDSGGHLIFSNQGFLIVNRGQFGVADGVHVQDQGAPSVAEIRLVLRDSDPNGNLWLRSFEWDLAEIAICIERPIRYFNEAAPPLDQHYNTANFPWRNAYLDAICGLLLRLAADWFRRVHLPYQAGGLEIDDKKKAAEYDARGQELWEGWKKFVQWRKVSINMDAAVQSTNSPYLGSAGYWH